MILKRFFAPKTSPAEALYNVIVAAARQPKFYAESGVPDTVDGRFDMIVAHLYLVLARLKTESPDFCQELTDYFFLDMDRQLRQMGVGDVSVGKRVRKMAEAFYGRLQAYEQGLAQGDTVLADAIERNIYGGVKADQVSSLVAWLKETKMALDQQSSVNIIAAKVDL